MSDSAEAVSKKSLKSDVSSAPESAAREAVRELKRLARPSDGFDASRYFRGGHDLGFYNVGTRPMRLLARAIHHAQRDRWTVDDAMGFAAILIENRYLEAKSVGIEVVACYRRASTPRLLPRWKRWLAKNQSANWATTDAMCGALIGPTLVQFPERAREMRAWSRHPNMWVRRASIVSLIPLARKGRALDLLYDVARRLHGDAEDLIQKAVGWALREAGKADERRLERYLRANGPSMPRTTLRYSIERFPPEKRRLLLIATKGDRHGS
jgi:3-methyladenine DNA glycosylase AlkD